MKPSDKFVLVSGLPSTANSLTFESEIDELAGPNGSDLDDPLRVASDGPVDKLGRCPCTEMIPPWLR